MSIIKFEDNVPITVTLDYDSPRTIEGTYGTQYQYTVNNSEDTFYATATLSAMISSSGSKTGDEITILKTPDEDERTGKKFSNFTVNGKGIEEFNVGTKIADSPMGAGFAHKDTKDGTLTMSDLDYRLRLVEDTVKLLTGEPTEKPEEPTEKLEEPVEELPF